MTPDRRSEGPRPGGSDGQRASGRTTKIPSRWSGGYRDKYGCTGNVNGGGGGRRETGTTKPRRPGAVKGAKGVKPGRDPESRR